MCFVTYIFNHICINYNTQNNAIEIPHPMSLREMIEKIFPMCIYVTWN